MKRIPLLLLMCICTLCMFAATTPLYKELKNLPVEKIYDKGWTLRHKESKPDEALACFTVITERIGNDPKGKDAELMVKTYTQIAYIYFFYYYDYTSSFNYISKAQDISEKIDKDLPELDLYTGLIYSSLAQQSRDKQTTDDAFSFLHKAFDNAEHEGNMRVLNVTFANLMILADKLSRMEEIQDEWRRFKVHEDEARGTDEEISTKFNIAAYEALLLASEGRYDESIAKYYDILNNLPDSKENLRFILATYEFMVDTYIQMQQYEKALEEIDKAMKIASKFQVRESMLDFYRTKWEILDKLGKTEESHEAKIHFLEIKDSLLNFRDVANIERIKALNEIRKAEENIVNEQAKHRRLKMLLWTLAILTVTISLISYFIYRKYRQSRETSRTLYEKNQQILRSEIKERELKKKYETQIETLNNKVAELQKSITANEGKKTDTYIQAELSPEIEDNIENGETSEKQEQEEENTKYKNSSLSEESKADLLAKIENVLENDSEVFNTDFSLMRLAELVNANYKYVSQAINEHYDCNFTCLLSDIRIKEACHRLSDHATSGNLTIEALSLDLGFKSRTTFVSQFKKRTGLTPSAYQKEAGKHNA